MLESPPLSKPEHDADDRRALRRFGAYLEKHRPAVDARLLELAAASPTFAVFLTPEAMAANEAESKRSQELERRALLESDWGPYLENLRAQGVRYAEMGIELSEWYPLVRGVKDVLLPRALDELRDDHEQLRDVVRGTALHLDHAMAVLAESYLVRKRRLLAKARADLDLYARLFEHASLGMYIFEWADPPDPGSFRVVAMNQEAARIAGMSVDELRRRDVGRTLREIAPRALETDVPQRYAAVLQTGEPQAWDMSASPPDGAETDFAIQCFPLGERHIGVIYEDVTERRRMQRDLVRHVHDLERSNRELDEFAYVASHDLKSPLSDVRNLASWILEDAGDAPARRARAPPGHARATAARMERLLDDLLSTRARAGWFPSGGSFATADVVANVVALVARPGIRRRHRGRRAADVRAPRPARARDPQPRRQRHQAPRSRGGRVVVRIEDRGDRIGVRVSDDGPGIPAEFHERVFRMFQTLRPRDEVEGSGMGLDHRAQAGRGTSAAPSPSIPTAAGRQSRSPGPSSVAK